MLKKKFFAKALAFAMVTGLTAAAGPAGLASQAVKVFATGGETTTVKPPKIDIDYTNYTATITDEDKKATYVFLEVLKNENDSKSSAFYGYPLDSTTGAVTVDLSFLKANKKQYLRAYTDLVDDEGNFVRCDPVTVAAQPAKLSVKYDAIKGLVDGKSKNALTLEEGDKCLYQYKTLYGSTWADLEENTIKNAHMNVAGTTIVLRRKAVDEADGVEGLPAGAEIKVKIAAIPKAPKVTIDYVKGKVKLGKNTEYTTLEQSVVESTEWNKTTDSEAKGADIIELLKKLQSNNSSSGSGAAGASVRGGDELQPVIMVVRTKADKKAASAVTLISLSVPEKLGSDEEIGKLETDPNGTLTVGEKKLVWANTTKGISLKAEGGAFEYYDSSKSAWKSVAAGKTVEVKLKKDAKLKVRAAGVKATKDKDGSIFSGEQELTCKPLAAKLTVTVSKTEITMGGSATITATVTAVDGNNDAVEIATGKVNWKVSGGTATGNDATATITPSKAGKMTITATVGNVTSTPVEVTVTAAESD